MLCKSNSVCIRLPFQLRIYLLLMIDLVDVAQQVFTSLESDVV